MATLIFGMMQSLDGYVAGPEGGIRLMAPGPELGRYFMDHARRVAGGIYGRRMYDVMRYWDDDQPDWDGGDREFAAMWRAQSKWVFSRTLKDVGTKATLVRDDAVGFVRKLKEEASGEIDVAGPEIAASLGAAGLIDEYRLYIRPFVLRGGKPFFAGPLPALRLVGTERVGEDAVKVTYAPVRAGASTK